MLFLAILLAFLYLIIRIKSFLVEESIRIIQCTTWQTLFLSKEQQRPNSWPVLSSTIEHKLTLVNWRTQTNWIIFLPRVRISNVKFYGSQGTNLVESSNAIYFMLWISLYFILRIIVPLTRSVETVVIAPSTTTTTKNKNRQNLQVIFWGTIVPVAHGYMHVHCYKS